MSAALTWLLDGIAAVPANDARVADVTLDSREVRDGSLFLALAGGRDHGLKFAAEAASRGASAVLWEPGAGAVPPALPASVFAAPVPGLRASAGRIADRFFGWPSSNLRITGITGTNGKTTSAYLLAQCLEKLGAAAAYIGTIGFGRPKMLAESTHTTPDAINVHRILSQLRSSGVREVAMEVSSHALDQGRVSGVHFHTAAFTNLTRDHLDYHGSMANYGAAKKKLLLLPDLKHVVVNVGDDFGREFACAHARAKAGSAPLTAVWVGAGQSGWMADAHVYAAAVHAQPQGLVLDIDGSFGKVAVSTRLMGRFNAENVAVVIACLLSLGLKLDEAAQALETCDAAPGRMEVVNADAVHTGAREQPTAVVDYAHTPDALEKALAAAREHCAGELWVIFGCGGDRDPGKRPLMGAIADDLADQIIVTDDNPRSENPQVITQAILGGIKRHRARVINDRGAAIAAAISEAGPNDVVLIAGKGHEDYQIYGDSRRSFSDRREALRHLAGAA